MFSRSGSYELQVSRKYDKRSYYTFTPKPLCSFTDSVLPMDEQMKTRNDMDILIKSALIHYQFEIIHPFEEGNGRVGRILAMLILIQNKLLTKPLISLPYYLFHNKIDYFDRLSSTQSNGNYAQWVKFFIRATIAAADNSINQIEGFIDLRNKNKEKI